MGRPSEAPRELAVRQLGLHDIHALPRIDALTVQDGSLPHDLSEADEENQGLSVWKATTLVIGIAQLIVELFEPVSTILK